MKKLPIALLMLIAVAAPAAHAADIVAHEKYCSDGFDKPATLVITADGDQILTTGKKSIPFMDEDGHEPNFDLTEGKFRSKHSDIETTVFIIDDRAFWPCD